MATEDAMKPRKFTDKQGQLWQIAKWGKNEVRCISSTGLRAFPREYVDACLKDQSPAKDFGS